MQCIPLRRSNNIEDNTDNVSPSRIVTYVLGLGILLNPDHRWEFPKAQEPRHSIWLTNTVSQICNGLKSSAMAILHIDQLPF
jgi:hypothetical protein